MCINHIKHPPNKSGGWQHQTNPPISHCPLFCNVADEGGRVYSGITPVLKENPLLGPFSKHTNKRSTVWSVIINIHQRAESGPSCASRLLLPRLSHLIFPHKLTVKGCEKCDFQLPLVPLALVSSQAPCLVLTQPADPLCPLCNPPQFWEEEAHSRTKTETH